MRFHKWAESSGDNNHFIEALDTLKRTNPLQRIEGFPDIPASVNVGKMKHSEQERGLDVY